MASVAYPEDNNKQAAQMFQQMIQEEELDLYRESQADRPQVAAAASPPPKVRNLFEPTDDSDTKTLSKNREE